MLLNLRILWVCFTSLFKNESVAEALKDIVANPLNDIEAASDDTQTNQVLSKREHALFEVIQPYLNDDLILQKLVAQAQERERNPLPLGVDVTCSDTFAKLRSAARP